MLGGTERDLVTAGTSKVARAALCGRTAPAQLRQGDGSPRQPRWAADARVVAIAVGWRRWVDKRQEARRRARVLVNL
jgi:hypothetical protein